MVWRKNDFIRELQASGGTSLARDTEASEEKAAGLLSDMINAATKKLVARGKERGYVTFDELDRALTDDASLEQIEDTMGMLSETGVTVIGDEEDAELQYVAGLLEEAAGKLAINMDERHLRIAEENRALAEMGEDLDRRLDEMEKRFAAI